MSPANATYPEELCLREVGGPEGGEAHEHAQLQQASLKKGKSMEEADDGMVGSEKGGGVLAERTDGRSSEDSGGERDAFQAIRCAFLRSTDES